MRGYNLRLLEFFGAFFDVVALELEVVLQELEYVLHTVVSWCLGMRVSPSSCFLDKIDQKLLLVKVGALIC